MKTNKEQNRVNTYFQDVTIKNACELLAIEKCLQLDGLVLPNNVIVNRNGISCVEFIQWYEKSQYPKTYDECCEVLMGKTDFQDFGLVLTKISATRYEENSISPDAPHISLINNFYKLLVCLDAYWKIASDKMGLDKLWEPDWNDGELKWCMSYSGNCIEFDQYKSKHHILAFPTEEMRDTFYENFNDLIEQCKELL